MQGCGFRAIQVLGSGAWVLGFLRVLGVKSDRVVY